MFAASRTRPRARIAAIVAALAGASALLVACGGGDATAGAGASDLAGFAPAGAPMYAEVSTDLDGAQWTQALALARKFPGYADAIGKLDDSLTKEGVDFETQVRPLLGSSAAMAAFDVKGFDKSDPDPSFMIAVDIADGKDADVLELLQGGSDPARKIGAHQGVDLYATGDDGVLAIVDGTLVASATKEDLVRVLDAHAAGGDRTLAGSKVLDGVFAELPDEVLAQAFIDVGSLVRTGAAEQGGEEVVKLAEQLGIGEDAAIGASLSAEQDGVRVKGVAVNLGGVAAQTDVFTPALTRRIPADAIAYAGLSNLYGMVERGIAQLQGTNPEIKRALSQASLALPLLGVNLDDLKNLASGEHAIAVLAGQKSPAVVAALDTGDAARTSATLETLRKSLPALAGSAGQKIPPFTRVPLENGVTGWRSAVSPEADVVYGVDGKLALIGTAAGALKRIQKPGDSLADDPDFQAATRQMPSKVGSVLWLDMEPLVAALERLGALKDAPAELLPNLRPVKNAAAWTTGGDKPAFEAFITIK